MASVKSSSTEIPIRVLLVDDESGYIDVLANRLVKRNFVVKKAYSGTSAIRMLRKDDYDVAVLDLKMEDMSGIDVLKIFKKMMPDMAVIMLTGHGSQTAARMGMNLGAFDYLTKPCSIENLVEKIIDAHLSPPPCKNNQCSQSVETDNKLRR
ncbi:MAG: response regulator [Desulfobacterales bacterium]|nr:response regulator [Desulfobacterales bacterium]